MYGFDRRMRTMSGSVPQSVPVDRPGNLGVRLIASLALGIAALLSAPVANTHVSPALASSSLSSQERLTVVGTRLTEGNAVDCPTVKADDGKVVSISYLPPSIAIGDRVSVTGFFAVTTHCRGKVLYAEQVSALGRD